MPTNGAFVKWNVIYLCFSEQHCDLTRYSSDCGQQRIMIDENG